MKTHYRCLRAIYNTQTKTYRDLLHINGKINIHTENIQILMTEIYKCLNKIISPITWGINNQKTKTYDLNTAVSKGAIIWNNLPNHFKEAKSLLELKTLIRG